MDKERLEKMSDKEFQEYVDARNEKAAAEKEQKRKDYEELKVNILVGLILKAENISSELKTFKTESFESMQTLYACLQEYSSRHGEDSKGNFTISNEKYKISYIKQGKGTFDERAFQAEKHIIDFLNARYSGDKDTKDLIISLLERKKGDLDINLIQKLYQMEERFQDENWKMGIELLKESYKYAHSKDYIKFEKKNENGEWNSISLQFSKI